MHHTCILALVNPGSLTMVGLQSTTYAYDKLTRTTILALVMPGWLLKAGLVLVTYPGGREVSYSISFASINVSTYLARIPGLFLQLSDSRLLRRLALVDQTCRELDAERFDGRAVLHDDHGADGLAGVLEDRDNSDGVNAG